MKGKRLLALAALVVALDRRGCRRPRSRTPRCSRPTRSPAGSSTRRRARSPCGSASRSKCRSAASACTTLVNVGSTSASPSTRTVKAAEWCASMPKVDDGTYVVTWRVTSADAHPVQGAFTFQVGAAGSVKNADALAKRLLASQGGSTTVGVVYAIDRVALFATLALLIGGIVFLSVDLPGRTRLAARPADRLGRLDRCRRRDDCRHRARGHLRVGAAAHRRSSTPPCSARCSTRGTGACRSCASGSSCSLFPLLRILLSRHPASEHPLRTWWLASAGVLAVGLSLTPGARGPRRHRHLHRASPFPPTPSTCWRWRAGWAGW